MTAETNFTITMGTMEQNSIKELINLLDEAPIELTNDNYVQIFRAIANKEMTVDELEDDYQSVSIQYIDLF